MQVVLLTRILAAGDLGWKISFEFVFKFGSYGGQTSSEKKPTFLSQLTKSYEPFLPPLELIQKTQFESQDLQLPSPFIPAGFPSPDPVPFTPSTSFVIDHSTSSVEYPSPARPQHAPSLSEPPRPPSHSRQRRGETLGEFLDRMAEEKRTSSETQSRKDREIYAAQKGYSKSCTVFEWEEIEGHYLRVKVDRAEVPSLWHDYPASRRVFHSHINEWDLCPPIPPFSEILTLQDRTEIQQYDDELEAPLDQYAAQHSGQMDELESSVILSSQPVFFQFDIVEHLRDQYGYDVHHKPSWTPSIHGAKVSSVDAAKARFLFKEASHHVLLEPAIENFCNVLANPDVRVRNLSQGWDLRHLRLQIQGLRLSLGTNVDESSPMYTISSTTVVQGGWVICVHNPTTILQIYRNSWTTLETIVRELVIRGIPFNTGVPDTGRKVFEKGYESMGLGLRPVGYIPRTHDYNAYVAARTNVFLSHIGRAALLKGGLIARLARDTVSVSDILSGPESSTSLMIGTVGGVQLVDDQLSDYQLDVISGVYYVETATDAKIYEHLSWWPKNGVWHNSGYFSEQWSSDAETWYQKRLKAIQDGTAKLYNSSEWKSELRRYKSVTRALLTQNDRLSKIVIEEHFSYAPFCTPLTSGE